MSNHLKTLPFSTKKQLFLLFHLTLGYQAVYPLLLLSILEITGQNALLDSGVADFGLSLFMLFSTLYLVKPLLVEAWHAMIEHPFLHWKTILTILPMMLVSSILLNSLAAYLSQVDQSVNQTSLIEYLKHLPWLILFQALFYAPIIEEIMFRGLLYRFFHRYSRFWAIFVSSLLFGFAHVSGSLFTGNFNDLWFLPTYMVLGYFLALAYERTDSLYTSMTLHLLNNLIGLWSISAAVIFL